jgi:hypothetical protein
MDLTDRVQRLTPFPDMCCPGGEVVCGGDRKPWPRRRRTQPLGNNRVVPTGSQIPARDLLGVTPQDVDSHVSAGARGPGLAKARPRRRRSARRAFLPLSSLPAARLTPLPISPPAGKWPSLHRRKHRSRHRLSSIVGGTGRRFFYGNSRRPCHAPCGMRVPQGDFPCGTTRASSRAQLVLRRPLSARRGREG